MSAAVKGQPVDEVQRLIQHVQVDDVDPRGVARPGRRRSRRRPRGRVDPTKLGELAALQGVVKFPVRIKCATLSWNALAQGLAELETAAN